MFYLKNLDAGINSIQITSLLSEKSILIMELLSSNNDDENETLFSFSLFIYK